MCFLIRKFCDDDKIFLFIWFSYNIDFYKQFMIQNSIMSGYEMVKEKLFIYMTYVVIKIEKYKLKFVIYLKKEYLYFWIYFMF